MVTAIEIVRALGGNEYTGMCRCPAHDDRKPSLHVSTSERTGKVLVHCLAGCPQQVIFDLVLRRRGWTSGTTGTPKADKQREHEMEQKEAERRKKLGWARLILRATHGMVGPVAKWGKRCDPASLKPYLRRRHIEKIPANALYLSQANARKLRQYIPGFKPFPAMVFPIFGVKGLQGASVTYLTADGKRNLRKDGDSVRRIYGCAKGGYVQIGFINHDKTTKRILSAEGIEDAMAVQQVTGAPAIAVLGAGNYAAAGSLLCKELILCGDNDEAGKNSVKEAAPSLALPSRTVRVAFPPNTRISMRRSVTIR
jgi:hypothetical protein